MMFKTAYNNDVSFSEKYSDNGITYGYYIDDKSFKRVFGKVGEYNAYAEIQRDKDNTDWSILKKYLFDSYAGGEVPGVYGDRSIECSDIIDAQDFMERCQGVYDNLPVEVKDKYGSLMEFVYGFNQEDLLLFKNNNQDIVVSDDDNKGDGKDVK